MATIEKLKANKQTKNLKEQIIAKSAAAYNVESSDEDETIDTYKTKITDAPKPKIISLIGDAANTKTAIGDKFKHFHLAKKKLKKSFKDDFIAVFPETLDCSTEAATTIKSQILELLKSN